MAITYSNKNFTAAPRPGQLRQIVQIGRTVSARNENGYPEHRDEIVCRVFAMVEKSGNNAMQAAGATGILQAMNFSIRYRDDVVPGMWVMWRGVRYDIIDTVDYDGRRRYLGMKTMTAQEV